MREHSGRITTTLICCLVLAGIFGFVAYSIGNGSIVRFDTSIIQAVQGSEAPWLTSIMKVFTTIGSTKMVLLICVVTLAVLLYFRQMAQALLFIFAIGGTVVLNQLLKFVFQRARPDSNRLIEISGFSFPSGHTMMATSLYAILAFILWRSARNGARATIAVIAVGMIGMICISRIYLGVHFPSDIVGGLTASTFWILIVTTIYTIMVNKHQAQSKSIQR